MSNQNVDGSSKEQLKTVLSYTLYQNLLALKEYFPNFYNRFLDYKPKTHALELTEDGTLNVAYQGGWVYDGDPQKVCSEQFDAFFHQSIHSVYTINDSEADKPDQLFRHVRLVTDVSRDGDDFIAKSFTKKFEPQSCYPILSIIGVGMGYHLERLVEKNIQHICIYEPNNDLFYASLHVVDYRTIFEHFTGTNKGITLEIGSEPEFYIESLMKILHERGLYRAGSFPVYRHYQSDTSNEALKRFFDNVSNFYNGFGFFEDEIVSTVHTMRNIRDHRKFLPSDINLPDEFKDKPVFICANGPSLDENIEYLKENRDKYYLFSGGSALMPLYKAGLTPDLHFEIERTEGLFEYVSVINDDEYYKKITLVAMNTVSPKVLNLFGDVYLYFKPNDGGTELLRTALGQVNFINHLHLFSSNPTVSNAAFAFAVKAGFNRVYFHGVDLGFIDPNYHHSKDSIYFKEDKEVADFDGHANNKRVKGNFQETVFSNMIFDWSRHTLEHVLRTQKNEKLECFNCSNGANIDRATPLKVADLKLDEDGPLPDLIAAMKQLNVTEPMSFPQLVQKVEQYREELWALMDHVVNPRLGEVEVNQDQLMDHFNYQYYYTRDIGQKKNVYICRMLIGSLNYLQTVIVGKLHFIRNQSLRDEYSTSTLKYLVNYMNVMKQEYDEKVVDWMRSEI